MKVSQKIFLRNTEGKILALRRPATDPTSPLQWDIPGGTVEEREDLEESLKREALEEVGITITNIALLDVASETSKSGNYKISIAYTADGDLTHIVLSEEHDEYRFVTVEEFLELETNDRLKRFVKKII